MSYVRTPPAYFILFTNLDAVFGMNQNLPNKWMARWAQNPHLPLHSISKWLIALSGTNMGLTWFIAWPFAHSEVATDFDVCQRAVDELVAWKSVFNQTILLCFLVIVNTVVWKAKIALGKDSAMELVWGRRFFHYELNIIGIFWWI